MRRAGLLAAALTVGCARSDTVVGHRLGWFRGFQLPEVTSGVSIGQRFVAPAGTIDDIALQTVQVGTPKGALHIELRSIVQGDRAPAFRIADVRASDVVRDRTYHVSFPPLEIRDHMCCDVEITSSPDDPASGVALWAVREPSDSDDTLTFDGKPRWGHLAFDAHLTTRPSPLRTAVWVSLALLFAGWGVLASIVRALGNTDAFDSEASGARSQ